MKSARLKATGDGSQHNERQEQEVHYHSQTRKVKSDIYMIDFYYRHMYIDVDTTYNLGNFFVSPTSYRNTVLEIRRTRKTSSFCSVIVHYRCDTDSYRELLGFIRQELGESAQITIGSGGERGIQSAVKEIFPNSIHLHCTRHVKKNIERHLLKSQLTLEDRQRLLELMFDTPASLIQLQTEHQYNERLNGLRDMCNGIVASSTHQDQLETENFYTWFLRYQNDFFQNHLIPEVRVRASLHQLLHIKYS